MSENSDNTPYIESGDEEHLLWLRKMQNMEASDLLEDLFKGLRKSQDGLDDV